MQLESGRWITPTVLVWFPLSLGVYIKLFSRNKDALEAVETTSEDLMKMHIYQYDRKSGFNERVLNQRVR